MRWTLKKPSEKKRAASDHPRSSNLEIWSPDQVELRILHVTLDGGILSWKLIHRNKPFTATNAVQLARLLESKSPPFVLLMSFLLFFPPFDERKKENMTDRSRKKLQREARILVNFEDDLLSSRSPPFYKWMNEFTIINARLENTWVPEKSVHDPWR